jgi:hypothetical protein
MLVNQIAVFLENKQGRISDFCSVLGKTGINLITMSIADTNDFGILRAITSDNEKAEKALKEAGFTVTRVDLLGIEVEDKPGALYDVLSKIDDKNINIEYLYSYATKEGTALIIFKVSDPAQACEILKSNGLKIIDRKLF